MYISQSDAVLGGRVVKSTSHIPVIARLIPDCAVVCFVSYSQSLCTTLSVKGRCDGVNVALPAETGRFQENVGTERCPQGGRSLDHQVLPVHLAPGRCEKEEDKFIPTVKGHISVFK